MRFLKNNQVIIGVIAFMLITAGYLNFSNNENKEQLLETSSLADSEQMAAIGDATLVSTEPIENEATENTIQLQETSSTSIDEYFTKSRLERDTMYSQMIESYQKILEKSSISETQRQTAQKEITKLNEQKNAIMITENLIKTKGIEDLVIFINEKSINVVIKSDEIQQEEIAQIQNIISREFDAEIENIHITNKQ